MDNCYGSIILNPYLTRWQLNLLREAEWSFLHTNQAQKSRFALMWKQDFIWFHQCTMACDDLIGAWVFLLNIQQFIRASEECIIQGLLQPLYPHGLVSTAECIMSRYKDIHVKHICIVTRGEKDSKRLICESYRHNGHMFHMWWSHTFLIHCLFLTGLLLWDICLPGLLNLHAYTNTGHSTCNQ